MKLTNNTRLSISTVGPFDFLMTATSHGWVGLAPNAWNGVDQVVQRTELLASGQVVLLHVNGTDSVEKPEVIVDVQHSGRLSEGDSDEIVDKVRRMLRLDEDYSEFYALCHERGGPWIRVTAGLGRLLRSPTVFEDVVKTICTTNIQWGGTKRMVTGLVNVLGEPYPDNPNLRAFPTPEAIAAAPAETFTETVRLGYRGDYIYTLARRVADGELDLEQLMDSGMPTEALRKELLAIKGVGNYAAATVLMLLGRYDELAVDTEFRSFVSRKYYAGQRPSDQEAQAIYEEWGKWKYLAFWFDAWEEIREESGAGNT